MAWGWGLRRRTGDEFTDPGDSPELFERIAHCYDGVNRLLSFGRERHWRKLAADALRLNAGGRVLDVGTGTGDMALALAKRWPGVEVVGLDPTASMLEVARRKREAPGICWIQADGLHLPFADASFDGTVSAFVLRNVVDVPLALAEQRRVVRNGGWGADIGAVVCLELSWPQTPIVEALFRFYFAGLMPLIVGALTGHPAAYRYLPHSVHRFLTPRELTETMEGVGLQNVQCRRLALGTVMLHRGEQLSGRTEGGYG